MDVDVVQYSRCSYNLNNSFQERLRYKNINTCKLPIPFEDLSKLTPLAMQKGKNLT